MTRQAPPNASQAPQTACNELLRLAHDDIGAWEGSPFLSHIELKD